MVSAITISIDGQEIVTQPGKTIIQAAMESGLYIPYLCYYPGMKPFGACRMCVVEVENTRGTPASCTTPVANGMVVSTNTPLLLDLRKGITELIISEHPHGCLTCHRTDLNGANLCGPEDICQRHVSVTDRCVACPKNERCELKDTTIFVGTGLTTPLTYQYRNLPVLTQDPFYDLDYNLCIVCGRCVRACEELRGDSAITFTERAGISLVGPAHGASLLESGCEFCGSCIDVCPVGALVESDYKWEKAVEHVSTTCPHCPVGCQLKLEVNKRGKVIRAIPELEAEANHGQACFKGKFGLNFINSRNRLKTPLVRRNGSLEEASWEEALALVAEKLSLYKGDQFAAIASYRGTNEENYLLQ
ncbi:MAG: (2Fe-2S)-binding protein, partial [Chloroflexi bacterium]|nr:(2Fe-2S)-binding protein [Chloroflexota bacterium]